MKREWLRALVILAVAVAQPAAGQVSMPVAWTAMVGASASGNTLTNIGGIGSGGVSTQRLASGDGYVEVTVADPTMDYVVSLGSAAVNGFIAGRALHLAMFGAEVREGNWGLQANTLAKAGDVFRIAVVGGQVQYSKNGTVFYTSSTAMSISQYPLAVFASLWSFGAIVSNANLSATFSRGVPAGAPTLSALSPHAIGPSWAISGSRRPARVAKADLM